MTVVFMGIDLAKNVFQLHGVDAENLSDSYVARYLRLAYLSPEVLEALILQRRPSAVRLVDLVKIATQPWVEQVAAVFDEG